MSGGIEYALRLREVEAEAARLRRDLDAVGHALGVCYDHDHGCGGHGPVEEMIRAAKDGCAMQGRAIDAEAQVSSQAREIERIKGRLARVLRLADSNIVKSGVWSRRRSGGGR
jgi:hypothetical protein